MPRLDEMQSFQVCGYNFTGAGLDKVADYSTQQTLLTLAIDTTSSMSGFEPDVNRMVKLTIKGIKKLDQCDSIMVRVITFAANRGSLWEEIHGFIPVMDINEDKDYKPFRANGTTPLNDTWLHIVSATEKYASNLGANDFLVNGMIICLTDGVDVGSTHSIYEVKDALDKSKRSEKLESIVSILIGVNCASCLNDLKNFKDNVGIDYFIDGGDLTENTINSLVGYISNSVASQSSAIGSGSASQAISASL